MKKLIAIIVTAFCTVLLVGCSLNAQSKPSFVASISPESTPSGSVPSNAATVPLVGSWLNPSCDDGAFRGFWFGEDGDISFNIGVYNGGYDTYFGSYSVEADALIATFQRSMDDFGEHLSATVSIENDVLTLTNIHEEPFNSPFVDGSTEGLIGMAEISFERAESPLPDF